MAEGIYKGCPFPKLVSLEERRSQVAFMVCTLHMKSRDIAKELGVAQSTIKRDIKWLRSEWQKERIEHVDEVRQRELAELDEMETICAQRLMECKNPWQGTRWMEERRKIKERRAKLLGLDAPEKSMRMNTHVTINKEEAAKVVEAVVVANDPLAIPMHDDTESEFLDESPSE